ncbi:MAG: hypothetical protein OHK93_006288 [Ramalina farinacea]|uniref:NACHT domain-containing protein n=1 Tax=Ramalina farinacea TaxID=258253 RepID=A0AA43QI83_9LECA|nr:hypothetical protein [Ramalina farinacea]
MMRNARLAQTGQWIFDDVAYSNWCNGVAPIFWGQGKPGVGKSVLLSCVVDRLVSEKRLDEGVAYFYCDYSRAAEAQSAVAIVTSLLHQLLLQLESIPEEILSLCQDYRRHSSRPNLSESTEMLHKVLYQFSATWLLVDALDELEANAKDDFMEIVESLKNNTKFFFTSRPQSLDSAILEESSLHCTLSAQKEDLATYIKARMGKAATASRQVRQSPGWNDFVDETVNTLVSIADGMFILVSLQLDMLLRPRTLAEMRDSLSRVSDKLDDFYAATLQRIRARELAVAVNVLCWLVKQRVPLTARALQEALAVEESTQTINPEAFIHKDDMIEMCCGLLVIDENEVLSLAHATVHDFLSAKLDEIERFDDIITKTCLKCLSFENFQQTSNYGRRLPVKDNPSSKLNHVDQDYIDQVYIDRTRQHPFFYYAASYWDDHYARSTGSDELTEMALRLLGGPNAPPIFSLNFHVTYLLEKGVISSKESIYT